MQQRARVVECVCVVQCSVHGHYRDHRTAIDAKLLCGWWWFDCVQLWLAFILRSQQVREMVQIRGSSSSHTHTQLTVCGSKINEHFTVCCCCCCWWSRHRISWVQNKFKMMLIDALDGLLTLSIRVFCVRNSEIHFFCCCCLYMRRTCKHAGNCWILMMNGRRTVCIVCPLSANQ